jgi:hypothetical protein
MAHTPLTTVYNFEPYIDERGDEHQACHMCGADCSTHPDAGNPLACCGDCGKPTCPDHRVDDSAQRCNECAAVHYAYVTCDIFGRELK